MKSKQQTSKNKKRLIKHILLTIITILLLSNLIGILSTINHSDLNVKAAENEKKEIQPKEPVKPENPEDVNGQIFCFPAGTQITMANGNTKNIENIRRSDRILSYDLKQGILVTDRVNKVFSNYRNGVFVINNDLITLTEDHPLYTKKTDGRIGWASITPVSNKILPIEVGDEIFTQNEDWIQVSSINYIPGRIRTYTFAVVSTRNYFANNILAHMKIKIEPSPEDTVPPEINNFNPPNRDWDRNSVSVTISCSDNRGLKYYFYKWTKTTDQPVLYDDGEGFLSGLTDSFTAILLEGDGQWYLHVKIFDAVRNSKTSYSGTYDIDQSNPMGYIMINNDETYTITNKVNLTCKYKDRLSGVEFVHFSNDGIIWSKGEAPSEYRIWDLADGDGEKTVYYQVTDYAGNINIATDTILLDTQPPTGSITINNGDLYTNNTNVNLFLTYYDETSETDTVRFSNDDISWSNWEEPSEEKPWNINGDSDGLKTVFYQLRDIHRHVNTVNDVIIFDKTRPIINTSPETEILNESNINTDVSVEIIVIDIISQPKNYRCAWSNYTTKPTKNWTEWKTYEQIPTIIKDDDYGTFYLHIEATDNAGNKNYTYSGPYILNNPPSVEFNMSATSINNFETMALNSNSSDDNDIVNYSWDLNNDGTIDMYGQNITYKFNLSYNYTIKHTVTDSNGASHTQEKNLIVREVKTFTSGKNYYVWRKNNSIKASQLANLIGLKTEESIQRFNHSINVCDWNETYIANVSTNDFTVHRYDSLIIRLDTDRTKTIDFGIGDTLNTYINRSLKYTVYQGYSNDGYNAIPWTKEKSIRASKIADEINLPYFHTISVFNKTTDTYKTYLKIPGNPTAGNPDFDPIIRSGDILIIKVSVNTNLIYDSFSINHQSILGNDIPSL